MTGEYFLSINDVSTRMDVPAHTLRYWEKQFPTMIKPTTGAGGRRYYRPETVTALEVVKELLYNRGMTIAGVKKLMKDGTFPENTDKITLVPRATTASRPRQLMPTELPASKLGLFSRQSDIDSAIELLERARATLG